MRRHQRAQALVGVLVVMLILFALAGAVTVATSVLLRQRVTMRTTYSDDFTAQNAIADAISQVADPTPSCPAVDASFPSLSTPTAPLTIHIPNTYPSPLTGVAQTAYCRRVDHVDSILTYTYVTWDAPGYPRCIRPLSLPRSNIKIFFDARRSSSAGSPYAYVDNNGGNSSGNCRSTPPQFPSLSNVPCGYAVSDQVLSTLGVQVVQLALNCDLSNTSPTTCASVTCYLHIANLSSSLSRVFIVNDGSGGSIYLLASGTGLRSGQDYEEAVFLVNGITKRLTYEARLP